MINHEIHASHKCFVCDHNIPWTGDVFGNVIISHGNEVDATIAVSAQQGDYVECSVQLQCPECGGVNQFKVLHHR
ncbi:hypothetical protein NZD89_09870 [Alicyclobacillus fastidiosus]|uniref:Uncharacterized protein n=1 Tax=Alicyclobacillus fastidiosus TaxID=392011 RepID=A0ABY6ZM30_9BACL|nr:hypothetical protein [Alicyclobacillus fastidiosus]WAH43653.1 hypothetical protein NZD89_09870 [Alicyclobacillus fastidiosus]GMA59852.1 hypothetical protein GCM10025859_02920 [Alicyclobacillus fastidiosus]